MHTAATGARPHQPMSMPRAAGRLWALGLALPLWLSACSADLPWDQEYRCQGQETTHTQFDGDEPGRATRREAPMAIDFHLRHGAALVKTRQVAVQPLGAEQLRLHAAGEAATLEGHFHRGSGELLLEEVQRLRLANRTQTVRSSGRYRCTPV